MKTSTNFPYGLNWTSQDIADAVPLRLFELIDFDAARDGLRTTHQNASAQAPRRAWRRHYATGAALPARMLVRH